MSRTYALMAYINGHSIIIRFEPQGGAPEMLANSSIISPGHYDLDWNYISHKTLRSLITLIDPCEIEKFIESAHTWAESEGGLLAPRHRSQVLSFLAQEI